MSENIVIAIQINFTTLMLVAIFGVALFTGDPDILDQINSFLETLTVYLGGSS